jgi:hypothetical protein
MNTELTHGDAAVKGRVEYISNNKPRRLIVEDARKRACDKRFYEAIKAALTEALTERYPDPAEREAALIDAVARADAFDYAPSVIVAHFGVYDRI